MEIYYIVGFFAPMSHQMSSITKGKLFKLPILFHYLRLYKQVTAEKHLSFSEISLLLPIFVPIAKSTETLVLQLKIFRGW